MDPANVRPIRGRSIRMFLVDGSPTGLIIAEIVNWTGKVIVVPRAALASFLKRKEALNTGVYILSGQDPDDPFRSRVYVGETESVGQRLRQHDSDEQKDFFDRAIVFVSKDENAQSDERFGHDLEKLWAEVKRVTSAFVAEELIASVDPVVAIFHSVDGRADAFRYATNPKGDAQMPDNAHVVYHELITQMDEVHTILELAIDEFRIQEARLERAIDEAVANDRL
jgi:hypothetical protein